MTTRKKPQANRRPRSKGIGVGGAGKEIKRALAAGAGYAAVTSLIDRILPKAERVNLQINIKSRDVRDSVSLQLDGITINVGPSGNRRGCGAVNFDGPPCGCVPSGPKGKPYSRIDNSNCASHKEPSQKQK